jgi:nucleoside-diphosphate kinase
MIQRTLVIVKPDGMALVPEIRKRISDWGFTVIREKRVEKPGRDILARHYDMPDDWIRKSGESTVSTLIAHGRDVPESTGGLTDPMEVGRLVLSRIIDWMDSPILVMVAERENAVAEMRKCCGHTEPMSAGPGTIRGDMGYVNGVLDTYTKATLENRSLRNVIHASDSVQRAKEEIALWFGNE